MADGQPRKRWWRRRRDTQAPAPASRVCPSCNTSGPVRLMPGEVCAVCASQRAWAAADSAGVLVVDRQAIAEAVRRRERAAEPWWRRLLAWVPALVSVAVAGASVWLLKIDLAARPIGPLRHLFEDLHDAAHHALWVGIGTALVGLILLGRMRRRRHHRRLPMLAAHLLAIMAGLTSVAIAGVQVAALRPFGGRYSAMPPPEPLGVSMYADRIVAATVIVAAPDGDGDARNLALGTGAIIGGDRGHAWIVTCSHVAMPYAAVGSWRDPAEAQPVWVQLSDGREGKAVVRWAAPPPIDIAVVELPVDSPPAPVPFAHDSQQLELGADVMFVPNPLRDGWLLHRGHLIRKEAHHSPAGVYELLVTDLPIIPGDSGSGLYDSRGRLVGLNTWVKIENGFAQGISLPAEAMAVLADAAEHGQLDRLDSLMKEH